MKSAKRTVTTTATGTEKVTVEVGEAHRDYDSHWHTQGAHWQGSVPVFGPPLAQSDALQRVTCPSLFKLVGFVDLQAAFLVLPHLQTAS